MIDDELTLQTAEGRAARALVDELQGRGIEVVQAVSCEDGRSVVVSDSAIHAILLDWTLGERDDHTQSRELLHAVRARNDKIPIFLLAERGEAPSIPIDVMQMVDEFVWTLEDTAAFVGGRVAAATRRYLEVLLPPLAAALMKFGQRLIRGEIEHVALDDLADRVLATSVVPYPPGIPMLMPGELTGAADGPYLSYLRALSAWDRRFPGFGHDTHGVAQRGGAYYVQCLTRVSDQPQRRARAVKAADLVAAK
jgi:hypothetical protein